ncbi:Magnetosome protein MamR [Azospirillaceae bacterium]
MIWTFVLRSSAVVSLALAVVELCDLFQEKQEIAPNRIYSSEEAASLFGVERAAVVRLARQGAIKSSKVNGNYRILGQSLLDYLKR